MKNNKIQKLVFKVFNNKDGMELLNILQATLFCETPTIISETNAYIHIDGKRQLVRDFITMCNQESVECQTN
jgi:hypothetical protein